MRVIVLILILVLPSVLLADRPRIIQHNFEWFTVWVDCNERGPIIALDTMHTGSPVVFQCLSHLYELCAI